MLPGLHRIAHRGANSYLIEDGDELVLVDTGFPDSADAILTKVAALGRSPQAIGNILLTHAHYDHIGSLAVLVRETGAKSWIHAADRAIAEGYEQSRPLTAAPGLLQRALFALFSGPGRVAEATPIDHPVADGDIIPLAGGIRVHHLPGHCAGQVAYHWLAGDVLIAGDVAINIIGLGDPIGFEDRALGRESQRKLAAIGAAHACFGHGKPIIGGASDKFARRWPSRRTS